VEIRLSVEKSILRRKKFKRNKDQEGEWREIFKGRSPLRFPKVNKQDLSRTDQDHSRPSDLGNFIWRISREVFRSSDHFKVSRSGVAEVVKET
jgi:hypothetical protein